MGGLGLGGVVSARGPTSLCMPRPAVHLLDRLTVHPTANVNPDRHLPAPCRPCGPFWHQGSGHHLCVQQGGQRGAQRSAGALVWVWVGVCGFGCGVDLGFVTVWSCNSMRIAPTRPLPMRTPHQPPPSAHSPTKSTPHPPTHRSALTSTSSRCLRRLTPPPT